MDRKRSDFPSLAGTENTKWETAAMHISVAEEDIRKAKCRFNTPVEYLGCTNYLKYHADRFHTYINFPNKRDPDVSEQANQLIQDLLNALP